MLRYLKNIFFTFKKKISQNASGKKTLNASFDLDKRLVYSLSKSKIPTFRQLKYIRRYLSKKELLLISLSLFLIFLSLTFMGGRFYLSHLEIVPARGGEYTEGLIGSPKHINPLYSTINDVDSDITSLIFSSLYKRGSNGELMPDLVEDFTISEDEKEYTFTLKQNLYWHDGEMLTSDDVVFTINAITNPAYQSPRRQMLSGVQVEKINDTVFKINLSQSYAAFRDMLTFGIMPAHLWEQLQPESVLLSDLNLKPIGSGPYKFKRFLKDSTIGRVLSFELEQNDEYYGDKPYINKITFYFFPNFEELLTALNSNSLHGIAYLPKELKSQLASQNSLSFYNLELSKMQGVYFNTKSSSAIEKKNVRQALSHALDKEVILREVFSEDVRLADSPLLQESFAYNPDIKKYQFDKNLSFELLEKEGWALATVTEEDLLSEEPEEGQEIEEKIEATLGTGFWMSKTNEDDEKEYLIIDLAIAETLDNIAVAEKLKKYWEDIGVKTIIKKYSPSEINTQVVRERNYDALLYTTTLSLDPDVYAFWHSSQAVSGGNNLSNYFNSEVDRLLSEARLISDRETRREKYIEFQNILAEDNPAIFLNSQRYTYVQKKDIKNFDVSIISEPSDRFSNISDWYIRSSRKIIW